MIILSKRVWPTNDLWPLGNSPSTSSPLSSATTFQAQAYFIQCYLTYLHLCDKWRSQVLLIAQRLNLRVHRLHGNGSGHSFNMSLADFWRIGAVCRHYWICQSGNSLSQTQFLQICSVSRWFLKETALFADMTESAKLFQSDKNIIKKNTLLTLVSQIPCKAWTHFLLCLISKPAWNLVVIS